MARIQNVHELLVDDGFTIVYSKVNAKSHHLKKIHINMLRSLSARRFVSDPCKQ